MLDQKIVFFHFGEVTLFAHFDKLGVKIRDAPLGLVDVSTQFTHLLLVATFLKLQVQGLVLLAQLLDLTLVTTAKVAHKLLVLVPSALQCCFYDLELAAALVQSVSCALKLLPA